MCGQIICYHAAAFLIPFNWFMQQDHVVKKLISDLLAPPQDHLVCVWGGGGGGVAAGKIFATMLLRSRFSLV